jgi:hypothetical protein
MFNINPLDVLGKRKLSFIPSHFAKSKISDLTFYADEIDAWIQKNLKGRYAITSQPSLSQKGSLGVATFVAFEDHKEITYFMLACPHLRRN